MGVREAATKKAYDMFGGANISANDSLLGETGLAGSAGSGAAAQDGNVCDNTSAEVANGDMVKNAEAGDIVVCGGANSAGTAGHTAILAEDWKGDQTQIINEVGAGDDSGVNKGPFISNFGSSLGHNQRIFCRPVKKANK